MKIANIVTKGKIKVSDEINVVSSMEEIIHGIPTLIVGFDMVEHYYPDFDILNIKIEDDVYWTVKSIEKRDKFEIDLSWFINMVINEMTNDVVYVFVDLIQFNKKTIRKIVKKIYSLKNKVCYQKDTMIYVYGEKLVFGIDLSLLKYVGGDIKMVKNKLIKKSSVFLKDEDILIYEKTINELGNNIRFTPYIYSLLNEKTNPTSDLHI